MELLSRNSLELDLCRLDCGVVYVYVRGGTSCLGGIWQRSRVDVGRSA